MHNVAISMVNRGYHHFRIWKDSAYRLEQYLSGVETIGTDVDYINGKAVTLAIEESGEIETRWRDLTKIRVVWVTYATIIMFLLLHLAILFSNIIA